MSDYIDMYLGKNIVNMFGWKASFLNKKKTPFSHLSFCVVYFWYSVRNYSSSSIRMLQWYYVVSAISTRKDA